MASDPHWIEKAVSGMKKKGTLGSFGHATKSKISHAKKEGGAMKKKAIFAQNVMKVSPSNVSQHFMEDPSNAIPESRRQHYQMGNAVENYIRE